MRKLTKRIAFTLLGGLLTLIALFAFVWFQDLTPAKIAFTTAHLVTEKMASTNFFAMTGQWPTSATELVKNSLGVVFIYPPPPFRDGWGRPTIYEAFSPTAGYGRVISYGRDGKPGGAGADADTEVRFP